MLVDGAEGAPAHAAKEAEATGAKAVVFAALASPQTELRAVKLCKLFATAGGGNKAGCALVLEARLPLRALARRFFTADAALRKLAQLTLAAVESDAMRAERLAEDLVLECGGRDATPTLATFDEIVLELVERSSGEVAGLLRSTWAQGIVEAAAATAAQQEDVAVVKAAWRVIAALCVDSRQLALPAAAREQAIRKVRASGHLPQLRHCYCALAAESALPLQRRSYPHDALPSEPLAAAGERSAGYAAGADR